jgi:putative hemolysin
VTSLDEIRLLASIGYNEGVVGRQAVDMIVGAAELRKLNAANVMVPRREVTVLSAEDGRADVLRAIRETGYSRFPYAATGDRDHVVGVVYAKEILASLVESNSGQIDWESLVHEATIVPETVPLDSLLRTFRQTRRHMALVVDEYGDFQGIVTLEDVIEEVVGDIFDESDMPREDIWRRPDGEVRAFGTAELHRLCRLLDIDIPEDIDSSTIGGLLSELQGGMPATGDVVDWRGYRLEVLSAGRRGVELVSVTKLD